MLFGRFEGQRVHLLGILSQQQPSQDALQAAAVFVASIASSTYDSVFYMRRYASSTHLHLVKCNCVEFPLFIFLTPLLSQVNLLSKQRCIHTKPFLCFIILFLHPQMSLRFYHKYFVTHCVVKMPQVRTRIAK